MRPRLRNLGPQRIDALARLLRRRAAGSRCAACHVGAAIERAARAAALTAFSTTPGVRGREESVSALTLEQPLAGTPCAGRAPRPTARRARASPRRRRVYIAVQRRVLVERARRARERLRRRSSCRSRGRRGGWRPCAARPLRGSQTPASGPAPPAHIARWPGGAAARPRRRAAATQRRAAATPAARAASGPSDRVSSAASSAAIDGKRASGSVARPRSRTLRTSAGTARLGGLGARSRRSTTLAMSVTKLSPANGRSP